MPGFEFFGEEERKEVNDVLETGILMRYGFDAPAKASGNPKNWKQAICKRFALRLSPSLLPAERQP